MKFYDLIRLCDPDRACFLIVHVGKCENFWVFFSFFSHFDHEIFKLM